ncbi:NtaA/DmoA family FMN-dependent monooxygenase [Kineobactrum salinum]|uniref:NtaA/DmoA family FMN-dependent monooxygenase n=1 Tax=Kineobactrum salinum TaxID=2708301 RepID=A0A6C0U0S4_9GAMM|nr:NtaA/DmoA family FMN-dependent monooxygenase [Kineobactrum salinum]QIB65631.1 NtaA/DmoA family FMN-dependent monooxygenase [Kineobactrum salinum]
MKKEIRLNALDQAIPSFQAFGLWTHPDDQAINYTTPEYWMDYAKLLERGLFDSLFLADVYGFPDVYQGKADAALLNGSMAPCLDPVVLIPLMASVTSNLCFTVTGSCSYELPFSFARRFSTLDHITRGRLGWNIVTSYLRSGALAMGKDKLTEHDLRYEMAEEFLEGVYRLWQESWQEGSVIKDKAKGIYADPANIKQIDFAGDFHKFQAIGAVEPSPQRVPTLFQAGGSERGRRFAALHAEGVYLNGTKTDIVAGQVAKTRELATAVGRNPENIKFFMGVSVFVDETEEAAKAKYQDYEKYASLEGLLGLMSGAMGIDLSQYPLDKPIEFAQNDANRTALLSFTRNSEWTLKEVLQQKILCGSNMAIVGTPDQVADELEHWMDETGIDGFSVARILAHDSLASFIDLVVPKLQERGRYKTAYREGTFRQKLGAGCPYIAPDHKAASYLDLG